MPSKEKLLNELEQVTQQLGHPPTAREMNDHGSYNKNQFQSAFGSWTEALKEAGYHPTRSGVRREPQEYIDEIQRLADELGHRPTIADLRKHGRFSISPYRDQFGSWSNALEEAGFEGRAKPNRSTEKYLSELDRLAEKLGHPPRLKDMKEKGAYSTAPYRLRFGSWGEALEAADLDPDWKKISDDDLINEIHRIAEEYENPPSREAMTEHGEYSLPPYYDRFGSLKEALEAAGFETDHLGRKISDKELIRELQQLAEEFGHPPTQQEYRENGKHSENVYYDHFGSWREALEAAGFESRPPQEKIPREDLIGELQRLADELGKVPFKREMNEQGNHYAGTYVRRLGSWADALEAAGLERD